MHHGSALAHTVCRRGLEGPSPKCPDANAPNGPKGRLSPPCPRRRDTHTHTHTNTHTFVLFSLTHTRIQDGYGLPLELLALSRELVVAYTLLEGAGLKVGRTCVPPQDPGLT